MMGFVAFLILAVGIVFVIAVAGGGDDDSGGSSSPSSPGDKTPKTTSTNICAGNTLYVPWAEPSSVLDPIQVGDDVTSEYIEEIFGGLVTIDLKLTVQPDIAKSWDVSADGKTYTFHLRDNVVFHSGKRVTAQDFKYSFDRAADPANASLTVLPYLGNVVGVKERFAGKAKEVTGVKVIDEQTLQITLTEAEDFFLAELTYPVSFVVNKDQIEKDPRGWTKKPDGTGPFKVKEITPADKVVLVKNDRYHLGAPKLDSVVFELGGGSVSTRYENNELHVSGVSAIDLEAVKGGKSPLSKDYKTVNKMSVSYLAFNVTKAPFDDPKVRQAFAMATDREEINHTIYYDSERVADGILPPEMPGYAESIKTFKFDPQKAKQLLAESKYAGKLPRVTLTYSGSASQAGPVLQRLQQQWQQNLGVQVDLQAVDQSAYLRERNKKTFQMLEDGWIADYPDPENFLGKLFGSQSGLNVLNYNNPEVDRLLDQARNERDHAKRVTLYNQAEQKILDDAVIAPMFWGVEDIVVKPCVKNWPSLPMPMPKYRYIEIDPNAK
jgi:oligopeptide transport system substrate-binding protein